jgi:hypothetical protein
MEKGRPMKQINHRPRRWTEYITRNKETEFFFRALGNGPLNSIEVLGTRSAGVTDFLQQLHRIYNHKMDATKQAQNLIMVFVSVEEVRTPADFFDKLIKATRQELKCLLEERIARSLKKELVWVGKEAISRNLVPSLIDSLVEAPAGKDASLNMEDFRTWVENLLMRFQSANFAFLIDGLDQIANHPDQFTLDFLNFLRALCRDGRLSWVVGTHRSVVEICHEISGLNRISPFSNIFSHRIILGTIDCQEAEELISVWAKERNVTINPTEIQAIQEIAGPWPRVLNAAADHWTSLKRIGMVDVKQEIIVQLLISPRLTVSGFMESYWHDLSSKEKDFLRSVINGEWQSSRSLSAQLELLGILKTTGQKTIITSRLFEEWVRTYSPVRNDPKWQQLRMSSLANSWFETGRLLFDLEAEVSRQQVPAVSYPELDQWRSLLDEQRNYLQDQLSECGVGLRRILERLDQLEDRFSKRLDLFLLVYQQVSEEQQALLADMLGGIYNISEDTDLMQRAVEQTRQAIEQIHMGNCSITKEVQTALEALADKGSKMDFNQKFELTLPVIPFLLNYQISFESGVELGAVWDELCQRLNHKKKDSIAHKKVVERK